MYMLSTNILSQFMRVIKESSSFQFRAVLLSTGYFPSSTFSSHLHTLVFGIPAWKTPPF